MVIFKVLIFVGRKLKLERIFTIYHYCLFASFLWQACGQVHVYLYLSTCEYTFDNTCTLLKYFLIPACVLYLLLKYQM